MGKTVLPVVAISAVALAAMLATLVALASPAHPQTVSEDLAADEDGNLVGPRPPDYEATEGGMLIIGGDVLMPCSDIGMPSGSFGAGEDPPEVEAKIERARRESIRVCQAAGFDTAGDLPEGASPSPDASAAKGGGTLPETGGVAPSALLLLAAGAYLAASARLILIRARR